MDSNVSLDKLSMFLLGYGLNLQSYFPKLNHENIPKPKFSQLHLSLNLFLSSSVSFFGTLAPIVFHGKWLQTPHLSPSMPTILHEVSSSVPAPPFPAVDMKELFILGYSN